MMANINGLYHSFKRKRTLRIVFFKSNNVQGMWRKVASDRKKKLEENTN